MSIRAVASVLGFAPDHWTPGTRIVAVALADHVNDTDGTAWPSITRLAGMAGMAPRNVQRHLRVLEDDGWILRTGQRRTPTGYVISNLWIWQKWLTLPPVDKPLSTGLPPVDKPLSTGGGVTYTSPGGVTPASPPSLTGGVTPASPKPSVLNHQREPSGRRRAVPVDSRT